MIVSKQMCTNVKSVENSNSIISDKVMENDGFVVILGLIIGNATLSS